MARHVLTLRLTACTLLFMSRHKRVFERQSRLRIASARSARQLWVTMWETTCLLFGANARSPAKTMHMPSMPRKTDDGCVTWRSTHAVPPVPGSANLFLSSSAGRAACRCCTSARRAPGRAAAVWGFQGRARSGGWESLAYGGVRCRHCGCLWSCIHVVVCMTHAFCECRLEE